MYRAVTRGIVVCVEPAYLPHESSPEEARYVWSYRVTIENGMERPVQLLSRRWMITDGNGLQREVTGRGVVGVQPTIGPGDRFEYTSGCPLTTPTGIMVGSYLMILDGGETLTVEIPAFSLDLPEAPRTLN